MEVKVETKITQVKDGSEYSGYLKIGQSTINWEMTFAIPIPRLDDELPRRMSESLQMLFKITATKDDTPIDLNDDEHKVFLQMLLLHVVEFYHLQQTRDSNDGLVGEALRGHSVVPGMSVAVSCISNTTYTLPRDTCAILNDSRFDCALAA